MKRRWNVHVVWFAIVIAGGMTNFYLTSYSVGYALTQLAWQNHREDHFGNVSATIWLLTRNDLSAYHRFSTAQLREGLMHLAFENDDWRCSDNQRRTLSRAGAWLKERPEHDSAYAPLQPFVEKGLRACERP